MIWKLTKFRKSLSLFIIFHSYPNFIHSISIQCHWLRDVFFSLYVSIFIYEKSKSYHIIIKKFQYKIQSEVCDDFNIFYTRYSRSLMHENNQFGRCGRTLLWISGHVLHRALWYLPSLSSCYGRRNKYEGMNNSWFCYGNAHIDLLCSSAPNIG